MYVDVVQVIFKFVAYVLSCVVLHMEKTQPTHPAEYTVKLISCGEHSLTLGEYQDMKKDSQKEYDLLLNNYRKESRTTFNVIMNLIVEMKTATKKLDTKKLKPYYRGQKELMHKYRADGKRLKDALIVNQSNKRWSLDKDVCHSMHKNGAYRKCCDLFFKQVDALFEKCHKYYEEKLRKIYAENIVWFENFILKIKK